MSHRRCYLALVRREDGHEQEIFCYAKPEGATRLNDLLLEDDRSLKEWLGENPGWKFVGYRLVPDPQRTSV